MGSFLASPQEKEIVTHIAQLAVVCNGSKIQNWGRPFLKFIYM